MESSGGSGFTDFDIEAWCSSQKFTSLKQLLKKQEGFKSVMWNWIEIITYIVIY